MPLPASYRNEIDHLPEIDRSVHPPELAVVPGPERSDIEYFDLDFDRNNDEIGRGGNAVVYKAGAPSVANPIALKEPFPDQTINRETAQDLLSEAKKWAKVADHPYITSVIDWGYDSSPWVAIEYMDGGPLRDRIGQFGLEQRLWTAYAIVDAVAYASGKKRALTSRHHAQ